MSWFVCIFADGNKMILQRLSFQQENVKGAVKQVFSEAGIQATPVLQTVHLRTKWKQIINPSLSKNNFSEVQQLVFCWSLKFYLAQPFKNTTRIFYGNSSASSFLSLPSIMTLESIATPGADPSPIKWETPCSCTFWKWSFPIQGRNLYFLSSPP